MRITGRGGQKGGQGNPQDRAAGFRRRRKVGEKVRGMLVRWESPGLAWVNIEGQLLLARIATRPQPGMPLLFLVKSMTPEIMLQELSPESGREAVSVVSLVQDYENSCQAMHQAMQTGRRGSVHEIRGRQAFFAHICGKGELVWEYALVLQSSLTLDSFLQRERGWRFLALPWLLPLARRSEMVHKPPAREGAIAEVVYGFDIPGRLSGEIRILLKAPKASYRVFVARSTRDRTEARMLAEKTCGRLPVLTGVTAECLGVSELPREAHYGPVGEILTPGREGIAGLNVWG